MTQKRRDLSAEERGDAERLRQLWEAKSSSLKLTQLQASREFGFANQSAISQYLNARIPLNLETTAKFARLLKVSIEEISPRYAKALAPESLCDCPALASLPAGKVVEADKESRLIIGDCRWYVVNEGAKRLTEGVFIISTGEQEKKMVRVEAGNGMFKVHGVAAKPVIIPPEAADLITVHSQVMYKIIKV